jgi:hypothetical protein
MGPILLMHAATQTAIATSSPKGKFIAAVSAAKTAKYLQSILFQIGFAPTDPTACPLGRQCLCHPYDQQQQSKYSCHINIAWFH